MGKINKDRTKEMYLWINKFTDIQKNEKDVKSAIISANNHYAGFGPMTAKLFAEMMDLKSHVKAFPILDYKIPSFNKVKKLIKRINKILEYINNFVPKARQTDISEFFQ